jgi:hypothetical protein
MPIRIEISQQRWGSDNIFHKTTSARPLAQLFMLATAASVGLPSARAVQLSNIYKKTTMLKNALVCRERVG